MSLLWRVVSALGASVLKAAGLFLCLFLVHLLITRAWPSLKASAALAAKRPAIEQQLGRLEDQLRGQEATAVAIGEQLKAASTLHLQQLQESVRQYEHELSELLQRRDALQARLQEARLEEEQYCSSWNPLKRYLCGEVRARVKRTLETVQPLIEEAKTTAVQLESALAQAKAMVREFESGDATTPDSPQAETLRLSLYENERRRAGLRTEIEDVRSELVQAREAEASPLTGIVQEMRRVGFGLLGIVAAVMLIPYLQRVFAYFVFMPWVERAPALKLSPIGAGTVEAGASARSLLVDVQLGERCWARSAYVRPVQGRTRSQWLFDWSAPFVSYAAGLSVVTRIEGPISEGDAPTRATLSSPDDPNSYLMEVRMVEHPGFVVHPRNLVALTGNLRLKTTWRPWSLHAWATGQLRFIQVTGSGRCIFEGRGDVVAGSLDGGRARIEQDNVIGFDTRLGYATARSETFLPYLLGRASLITDAFEGKGTFVWQKNPHTRAHNLLVRSFDAVFGALGKLLGF